MNAAELPTGWKRVALAELGEVRLGRQRSPKRATGPNMRPYMRAANVTWNGIDTSDVKEMDFTPKEFERYALHYGDVLVGEASGSIMEVGKSAVWRNQVPGACFQNTLIRIRLGTSCSSDYLQRHLTHDALRGGLASIARGVGIHHLGAKALAAWEIALPPREVQDRIVEEVDSLMGRSGRAKEALDAIPPLLERFRQSVLAAAFRGDLTADWRAQNPDVEPADQLLERIRTEHRRRWEEDYLAKRRAKGKEPKNDKWKSKYKEPEMASGQSAATLPTGWCATSIGTIAPLQAGYAFSSKGFREEGVRLLKGNNVRDGWLMTDEIDHWDPADVAEYAAYELFEGDVVLAMDRPVYSSGSRRTKVAHLDASWEGALLLQRVGRFRCASSVDQRFLFWLVSSASFRDHIIGKQKGSQDGKDLPHVSAKVVDAMPVALPPIAEQKKISETVDRILGVLAHVGEVLGEASRRRAALDRAVLAAAFRGRLLSRTR